MRFSSIFVFALFVQKFLNIGFHIMSFISEQYQKFSNSAKTYRLKLYFCMSYTIPDIFLLEIATKSCIDV